MSKLLFLLISLYSLSILAQKNDSVEIDSFNNSKIIIFSKEKSKSFVPDSIETFTPSKKDYYTLLDKVEKKSFKAWNRVNRSFYKSNNVKLKNDTLFAKIENEWLAIDLHRKKIGKENIYVQVWGAYCKNRKLLIYRIYDFNDGKNYQYISELENKVIEGYHGWFESKINNITIDLKTKKALNSLEFD